MKQIWSPWRMNYIMNNEKNPNCIFCNALQLQDGPANLVITRGRFAFAILNRFPYTSGHLMVVPFAHKPTLADLDVETRSEILELIVAAEKAMRKVYHPEGFNIGANIGEAAGAGIASHVHFHVVPRWVGDTNFMSTLGDTRVLPETLEQTYLRLKTAWTAYLENGAV